MTIVQHRTNRNIRIIQNNRLISVLTYSIPRSMKLIEENGIALYGGQNALFIA